MEGSDIYIHGNSWIQVHCTLHAVLQIGVASICGDDRSLSSLNINLKRSMELPQHVPGGRHEEQLGNTGTEAVA
jgi:hypothetical protein